MAQKEESTLSIIAAIVGNILIGIVKFIAATISGSAAMVSEGIHSIVDSGNGLLILHGVKRARKAPDKSHPFGYGSELYFWTLVVSVSIFAVGGGVSLMKGISAINSVGPDTVLGSPVMNYIVLAIAAVIEGVSLSIALRQFNADRGGVKPFEYIKDCKDPSLYTVVLEDSAAEAGLVVALLGIFLGHLFGNPYLDGIASVAIGLILMAVAVLLLRESKGLLIGEGMSRDEIRDIKALVNADKAVVDCGGILTLYNGPHNMLVTIDASFADDCTTEDILESIDRIEASITLKYPQAVQILIEAQSLQKTELEHEGWRSFYMKKNSKN